MRDSGSKQENTLRLDGEFFPKSKREMFSKELRQVHFAFGYDNNSIF